MRGQPIFVRFLSPNKINLTMGKSIHFSGQPLYSQVIKLLDKSKILHTSRKHGGEHYVKRFDGWTHLVVMLYAVIMRFDSLLLLSAKSSYIIIMIGPSSDFGSQPYFGYL